MKNAIIASAVLSLLLSACGGGGGGSSSTPAAPAPVTPPVVITPLPVITPPVTTIDTTKFTLCDASSCDPTVVDTYHVDQYYFNNPYVYDESVLPVQGTTTYKLWKPASVIPVVRSRFTGQVYKFGIDYTVSPDGDLVIPANSSINSVAANFTSTINPDFIWPTLAVDHNGGPLRFDNDYQEFQIAVTYMPLTVPTSTLEPKYPSKFLAKLKAGGKVAITYLGDSITTGGGSTAFNNMAPHQPGYVTLTNAVLNNLYPNQIYFRNNAVGGQQSGDTLALAPTNVGDTASDVVFIADGMNDVSHSTPTATFKANLLAIIAEAKSRNADVEVVLVTSFTGNKNWMLLNDQAFIDQAAAVKDIAATTPNVSVADMTSVFLSATARKSSYDLTGDGDAHPNDFTHVLYAQVILKTLLNQ